MKRFCFLNLVIKTVIRHVWQEDCFWPFFAPFQATTPLAHSFGPQTYPFHHPPSCLWNLFLRFLIFIFSRLPSSSFSSLLAWDFWFNFYFWPNHLKTCSCNFYVFSTDSIVFYYLWVSIWGRPDDTIYNSRVIAMAICTKYNKQTCDMWCIIIIILNLCT